MVNRLKTIQAAGVLLRKHHSRMGYMRLIKLLYIANRQSLQQAGAVIVDDKFVAMEYGPVLSRTLSTIKNSTSDSPEWNRYFAKQGYALEMSLDPGNSKLSRFEIGVLERVADEFSDIDDFELVAHTHQFPEWQKNNPGTSSKPIALDDILEALGLAPAAAEIHENIAREREIARRAETGG